VALTLNGRKIVESGRETNSIQRSPSRPTPAESRGGIAYVVDGDP